MGRSISLLTAVSSLSSSDAVPIDSVTLGNDARVTLANLAIWLQSQLTEAGGLIAQYFAPNATGWSVTVSPPTTGTSIHLLITPTAGFAAGTVTLPPVASCVDGQEVVATSTQSVAALTVAGNGAAAVNGAPTALAANGFFRLRFDGVTKSWYRVA